MIFFIAYRCKKSEISIISFNNNEKIVTQD